MRIIRQLAGLFQAIPTRGTATIEAICEAMKSLFAGDRQARRCVAFSVAMIALSAKMAKADGVVIAAEVAAFQQIFAIPPDEMRNVFRLYDLAKQDTAGYQAYAARLARLCSEMDADEALLCDVLDGLFHIAKADGVVHERELGFLQDVANAFGLRRQEFDRIRFRHVAGGAARPYAILGVDPTDSLDTVRSRYIALVRENHPDRLAARGVPDEFMAIATERMKAINSAYDTLKRDLAA